MSVLGSCGVWRLNFVVTRVLYNHYFVFGHIRKHVWIDIGHPRVQGKGPESSGTLVPDSSSVPLLNPAMVPAAFSQLKCLPQYSDCVAPKRKCLPARLLETAQLDALA